MSTETQTIKEEAPPVMQNIWDKVLKFLDRRKHTMDQNVRLGTIILTIILIIGIFLPLVRVTTDAGIIETSEGVSSNTSFKPNNDLLNISMDDFLGHKPLWDFEIYGTQINEIELFGINLYGLAMTPFPDYSSIKDLNSFFKSGKLDILVDEDLTYLFEEYLGPVGKTIVNIAGIIYKVWDKAGDVVNNVVVTLDNMAQTWRNMQDGLRSAEEAMVKIDNLIVGFFIFLFIGVILLIIGKGPRLIPAIILSIPTLVFVVLGIAVLVFDGMIAKFIDSKIEMINDTITTLGETYIPGLFSFLSSLFGWENQEVVINVDLICGGGWWLITLSLIFLTACAYFRFIVRQKQKKLAMVTDVGIESEVDVEVEKE